MKCGPCLLQLEKAFAKQRRPSTALNTHTHTHTHTANELGMRETVRDEGLWDYYENLGGFLILPMTLRIGHDLVSE